MGRKKRMSHQEFDIVYRAIFEKDTTKPKVKYTNPERW